MGIVLRALAAYVVLLAIVRLIGRRTSSQLAPIDLAVLFLFGGFTVNAVLADERSLTAAVTALSTVGLCHVGVSWLKARSAWFGRLVDGTPVVLYERGHWHEDRMLATRMQRSDVMAAVRQRGMERMEQVRYAVTERDGKISIIAESRD